MASVSPKLFHPEHFSEKYDPESDTYYVTFMTGEPSYCVEIDDVLLVEVGLYSHVPTGFRILNFTKGKPEPHHAQVLAKLLREKLQSIARPPLEERQAAITQALERVLA